MRYQIGHFGTNRCLPCNDYVNGIFLLSWTLLNDQACHQTSIAAQWSSILSTNRLEGYRFDSYLEHSKFFPTEYACHSLNNIFQIVVLFWNYNITIFLRNFWRHAKLRTPTEGNTKKDQLGLSVDRSEEDYNELQKAFPKIIGLTLLV